MSKHEDDIKGNLKERFIGTIAGKLIKLYSKCLTFEYIDASGVFSGSRKEPVTFAFWHNRIFAMAAGFRILNPDIRMRCLTSASRDGAMIEAVMAQFDVGSIRGSSSRRGKAAMIEMIRAVRSGLSLNITPDGPRGPVYELNPGVIRLSAATGAPMVLVQVDYSDYIPLRTWDKFRIPKPFSRVSVYYHKPIEIPRGLTPEQEEEIRLSAQETLISPIKYQKNNEHEEYRW